MDFGPIGPRNGVDNDEFMPFMILGTNALGGDLLFSFGKRGGEGSIAEAYRPTGYATAMLVSESAEAISAIAHDTGFYDHSYFTKQFKAAKGMSPSDYRRIGGERSGGRR